VIGIARYTNGFEVQTSAAKKLGIFLVPHPDLTKELVPHLAARRSLRLPEEDQTTYLFIDGSYARQIYRR